jgi:hypothetical protein
MRSCWRRAARRRPSGARLAALPYAGQLAAIEGEESYQRWGLCRLLQRRSDAASCRDPESAARLANLASRIPRLLEPAYHVDSIRDLQALSFCYLGNAWRALGEPYGAADAFAAARAQLAAGTGDPAVAAEALTLEALLLRDRYELADAVSLLDEVEALYGSRLDEKIAGDSPADPGGPLPLLRCRGRRPAMPVPMRPDRASRAAPRRQERPHVGARGHGAASAVPR